LWIICSHSTVVFTSALSSPWCSYTDSSHTEILRIGSMDPDKGYVSCWSTCCFFIRPCCPPSLCTYLMLDLATSRPTLFPRSQWHHHRTGLRGDELRLLRALLHIPRIPQGWGRSSFWRRPVRRPVLGYNPHRIHCRHVRGRLVLLIL